MKVAEIKERLAELEIEIPEGVTKKADLMALLPEDGGEEEAEETTPEPEPEPELKVPPVHTQASPRLMRLVSKGMTVGDAKAQIQKETARAKKQNPEPEAKAQKAVNLLGLPVGHPDSEPALKQRLTDKGIEFHPGMKGDKLIEFYRAEVIGTPEA